MPSYPRINDPVRDTTYFDRDVVRPTSTPRTAMPASPAGPMDDAAPIEPARLAGLKSDLQGSANHYANAAFNQHWDGLTSGLDANNNEAVEAFAKQHGVTRGRVGMKIDTGTNDMSGGALGAGIRQTGEYHTMNNEELLSAAKARAKENYNNTLTTGIPSNSPPSPAGPALGPIGPTPSGRAMGSYPASPAGPSPEAIQGYQSTLAGTRPDQTVAIAGRLGMQPYDVAEQQTGSVAARNVAQAIPGQVAAQNALTGAQAGKATADAGLASANTTKVNAEASTLIPAQAKEAEGRAAQAQGAGAREQAQATGAVLPDAVKKQLDDMTASHQKVVNELSVKLAAAEEQLRQARGTGGNALYAGGGAATGSTEAVGTPATSTQPFQPAQGAVPGAVPIPPAQPNAANNALRQAMTPAGPTPGGPAMGQPFAGSTVVKSGTHPDGRRVYQLADGRVVDQNGRAL